jgi:hypothetical protein
MHSIYYEERHDGGWRRLEIDGEMLIGRPHFVIYFGSIAEWNSRPPWARERRAEVITRIKSVFSIPDYEYDGEAILDARDRELLIAESGGLSPDRCIHVDCQEFALKDRVICVTHMYPGL